MIIYNSRDYNLQKIERLNAHFNKVKTKAPYYVFGLRQQGNPPIEIIQSNNGEPTTDRVRKFYRWLKLNGIESTEGLDYRDRACVEIGLRVDVRAQPKFAAALIRTAVAFFEGAVRLKKTYRIPSIKLKDKAKSNV